MILLMEDMYRRFIYLVYHFSFSYTSKRQLRRKFLRIYDLTKPVQVMAHIQNVSGKPLVTCIKCTSGNLVN